MGRPLTFEEYRLLVRHSPVMIWRSALDAKCDYFNQTWLEFTGRTIEQEMGDGWAEGVHPQDLERCVTHYATSFDARTSFSMEYRLRYFDGTYRWLRDEGVPRVGPDGVFAGYVGSCIDITDIRRSHEEAMARQKLESLGVLA